MSYINLRGLARVVNTRFEEITTAGIEDEPGPRMWKLAGDMSRV